MFAGTGSFSFHDGVDVVAADGTPVYSVCSGEARLGSARTVIVNCGGGVITEYWHIVPEVQAGQSIVAYRTVLGRVRASYGHVHLTERRDGHPVNPLAPGHLTPYDDHTAPRVGPIELRRPGTSVELLPELVRGRIAVVVQALDQPEHGSVDDMWAGMPTAPALVRWRVERCSDGTTVVPERTAFDVRNSLPPNREFWRVYARGTRQNMPTFKQHRYWRDEGVYLFNLGVLDTRGLGDGIYALVVTASDIRGNGATARRTFLIWNRPGWPPKTPQA